jgi:hypothetical protein
MGNREPAKERLCPHGYSALISRRWVADMLGSTAFMDRSFPFILNIYIIAYLLTTSIYGILQMVLA